MREEVKRTFPIVCLDYNRFGCTRGRLCKFVHMCRNFVKTGRCNKLKCPADHFMTRKTIARMRAMGVPIESQEKEITNPGACLNLLSDLICADMAPRNIPKPCTCPPAPSAIVHDAEPGGTEENTQGLQLAEANTPNSGEGQQAAQIPEGQTAQSCHKTLITNFEDIAAFLIKHDGWARWEDICAHFRLNPNCDHTRWAREICSPVVKALELPFQYSIIRFVYPQQTYIRIKPVEVFLHFFSY